MSTAVVLTVAIACIILLPTIAALEVAPDPIPSAASTTNEPEQKIPAQRRQPSLPEHNLAAAGDMAQNPSLS